jgi:hypothetical protein
MSDLKEDAAKASDAARVVANEAADLKENAAKASDAAQVVAGEAAQMALKLSSVRKALREVKRHPLAAAAALGAGAAFIEVELALGVLAGIGATALLMTANGAQTRQELAERARALVSRAKTRASDAAAAATEHMPTEVRAAS